jgi:hypothetical protein
MSGRRLDRSDAWDSLQRCHVALGDDFHALSTAQVEALAVEARRVGYRAPRHRNGSATRYFHAYLVRLAERPA